MIVVNGVGIDEAQLAAELPRHSEQRDPVKSASHELVLRELVRQRASVLGIKETSSQALMQVVFDAEIQTPEPDEQACRRYYEQHKNQFIHNDSVQVWHILFQLTPQIDAKRLRAHAGDILNNLHQDVPDAFAEYARKYSNCPSSSNGGSLGIIHRRETVPEFEKTVFALPPHSLLNRLVDTRHGFHIVRTGVKHEGDVMTFDVVRERIADWLSQSSRRRATSQYLQLLVGQAQIKGLDIEGADSPLLQ